MENEKKPRRHSLLNIFDIVVIAVIVVLAAVLIFTNRETVTAEVSGPPVVTVRYTMEITGLVNGASKAIQTGDGIVERVKKIDLGTIESVKVVPTTKQTIDYVDGRQVEAEVPGQETAIIVVTAEAADTDSALLVDMSFELRVGETASVKAGGCWGRGTVIAIERE